MRTTHTRRRLWIVACLAALSVAAGIGRRRPIQPSGQKAGLVRFDVVSEMNHDWRGWTNLVVFARYWVCEDYYVVSVIWTEFPKYGWDMRTQLLLSDEGGFRMEQQWFSYWFPVNTTYPKPVDERPPFAHGGGMYDTSEMRFAEAQALARRVYAADLGSAGDGLVDVNVQAGPSGVARTLARLKARIADDRIESMELFDDSQRLLAWMSYEYERSDGPPRLARLIAELPVRPEKLAMEGHVTVTSKDTTATYEIPDVNYVSHKGGRTCTVTYQDVTLGETVVRLPVQVAVHRTEDRWPMRSARLMNFQRVELDKDGVWEAARAFGGLDQAYSTWGKLVERYLYHVPNLGPLEVDPNDFALVRALIAKYPVWEMPAPPQSPRQTGHGPLPKDPEEAAKELDRRDQIRRQEAAQSQEQMRKWQEKVDRMPRPPKRDIEPADARRIRQLRDHYRTILYPWTEEMRTGRDRRPRTQPGSELDEIKELQSKLDKVLRYHRAPVLPEDHPPEVSDADRVQIAELKRHYEKLVGELDRGPGGRLKALHALARMDLIVKDYDAFEQRVHRYWQMLEEAGLHQMVMAGGYRYIDRLIGPGQCEKASALLKHWVEKSTANDSDGVYRFCRSIQGSPWAKVQLLDRFLTKPGLSPLEQYEGLALRVISLDNLDKALADREALQDESMAAQIRWVLTNTTRARVAAMVEPAVRRALAAWEALGPARMNEARPYSSASMSAEQRNALEAPDATRLQEVSAQLDQIVRERSAQQTPPAPRPDAPRRRSPTRR
ncbi:MAG: hypothetical protein GXX98_19080 [Planctomycetes bacterium]|nr:hypothetical protein [Planctomycetota bacterium]